MRAKNAFCLLLILAVSVAEAKPEAEDSDRWNELAGREYLEALPGSKTFLTREQITALNDSYLRLKSDPAKPPLLGQVFGNSSLKAADAQKKILQCLIIGLAGAMQVHKTYQLLTLPPDLPAPACDKKTTARIFDKFESTRTAANPVRFS